MKRPSRLTQQRDAVRRYTRRGVARAVLEHAGDEAYFEGRPIAEEYQRTYGPKRLQRWATERTPTSQTTVCSLADVDWSHPQAASWPVSKSLPALQRGR